MKPEAQRIAIAEACGWYRCNKSNTCGGWHNDSVENHPNQYAKDPPDYLNDLNAIHEATSCFDLKQTMKFSDHLKNIIQDTLCISSAVDARYLTVNATAAQRAEAFLKTIGKWES